MVENADAPISKASMSQDQYGSLQLVSLIIENSAKISGSCMDSEDQGMGESAIYFPRFKSNTRVFPLHLSHQIPRVRYPVFALIAAHISLRLDGKDVSPRLLFFLTYPRPDLEFQRHPLFELSLVSFDKLGNPSGLPGGLRDLPLYPDKDDWYSVLGTWNATADNPETPNEVAQANLENNIAIPIAPMSLPRNSHPPLPSLFCHYHKCTGHRLAVLFRTALYMDAN